MPVRSKIQRQPQAAHADTRARTQPLATSLINHSPLYLQRVIGNRGVRRLLSPGSLEAGADIPAAEQQEPLAVQTKSLEVSHPSDADEREADEVARKVVAGQSAEIKETAGTFHRKEEDARGVTPEFKSKLGSMRSSGQPLDDATRTEMESKMGADFSGVSIHTGSEAVALSNEVRAKAFTHGTDIYFGAGNYNPSSSQGRSLLAHELAHTVQQSRHSLSMHGSQAGVRAQRIMRSPDDFAEATKGSDTRTFYVRQAAHFNKIKQTLAKADIAFEGSLNPKDTVKKRETKKSPTTDYYEGHATITSATTAAVKKVFDKIVPPGKEVFVTKNEFVTKLQTVVNTFRTSHAHTFSNLQVLSILNQPAVIVPVKKGGKIILEDSCIETMNKCIENVYGSAILKKADLSDTAFGTIDKLTQKKLAGKYETLSLKYIGTGRFQIRRENIEKVTKFSPKSFAQMLMDMTKGKEDGFYVFVCSLFEGYHSIIIVVKKQKGKFRFEWKDQHKPQGREFDVEGLHSEFYDFAAGRSSWRIRHKYQEEYGGPLASSYEDLKDDANLKKIEALEKASIEKDLNNTRIALLNP